MVHRLSEEQLDRMAGKTNLLQIRIGEHPLYGKGVHSTLELPMAPDDPATVHMVNALNAWELSVADLPPHFGAWCIGNRAPAYVSFMPTQFCIPGTPAQSHHLDGRAASASAGMPACSAIAPLM